jgi:hypothetical protein
MSKQPIEWQHPLPWSFSTALSNACKPLSQNNPTSSQAKGEQQFDNIREDERIIKYRAREIEMLDKSGSMVKKTDYLITCVQGPVSDHNNLPTNIKIGDVIKIGKNLITANIIIATYAKETLRYGKEILQEAGTTDCTIVEREDLLPYDNNCKALWINVKKCRVLLR